MANRNPRGMVGAELLGPARFSISEDMTKPTASDQLRFNLEPEGGRSARLLGSLRVVAYGAVRKADGRDRKRLAL
jgi:hypothetical protein